MWDDTHRKPTKLAVAALVVGMTGGLIVAAASVVSVPEALHMFGTVCFFAGVVLAFFAGRQSGFGGVRAAWRFFLKLL